MDLDLDALQLLPGSEAQPGACGDSCTATCSSTCVASCTITGCGLTAAHQTL